MFALLAMAICFTACSSDGDEQTSTSIEEKIVGLWQPSHISGYFWKNDYTDELVRIDKDLDEEHAQNRLRFIPNGVYEEFYYSKGSGWISSFVSTYRIVDNTICLYYKGEGDWDLAIVSLNQNTVVFKTYMNDDVRYELRITCKRIE